MPRRTVATLLPASLLRAGFFLRGQLERFRRHALLAQHHAIKRVHARGRATAPACLRIGRPLAAGQSRAVVGVAAGNAIARCKTKMRTLRRANKRIHVRSIRSGNTESIFKHIPPREFTALGAVPQKRGIVRMPFGILNPEPMELTLALRARNIRWLATLILLGTAGAHALDLLAPAEVKWTLHPQAAEAAPGSTVRLKITAAIPIGWHIYSITEVKDGPLPTTFKVEPAEVVALAEAIGQPKPIRKFDEGFQKEIEFLEGKAEFVVSLHVQQQTKPGMHAISIISTSQLCKEGTCLFPKKQTLAFTLTVTTAAPPLPNETVNEATAPPVGEKTAPAPPLSDEERIAEAKRRGVFAFFWAAMGAGALALLTPCVFPMIPITVSFFTKRKQATRAASIRDATLYAVGIVLTFTVIGMVFAAFFGATGIRDFATNGWVNLAIAGIFTALALNLFGVFEIPLPTEFLSKVDSSAQQGGGVISILLMAFVFSITSFTCTVPFIGLVLISAAQGEWFMPLVGMIGFSAAFATPFFVLALFPSMLKSLPKSGGWLNSVKVVMGFLELGAALKFVSSADIFWNAGPRLMPRELFLCIWVALCLLTALYLLGLFQFSHDSKVEHLGGTRILFATLFLSIGLYFFTGLQGGTFGDLEAFIPQPAEAATTTNEPVSGTPGKPSALKWFNDFDAGLAEAQRTAKPMFVDFTGKTCGNCRVMENTVFPQPQVVEQFQNFILVKLYTDDESNPELTAKNVKLQEERFSSVTLPFFVVLSPKGEVLGKHSFDRDVSAFAAFLKGSLEQHTAATKP